MSFLLQCEHHHQQQNSVSKAQQMEQGSASGASSSLPEPADMYQEDECDVGPRAFRKPLIPEACGPSNPNGLTEAFLLYNEALISHSRLDYVTATRLYKAIAHCCIQDNRANFHPRLVHLGMLVNNNLGQISYRDGSETDALSHFESALVFAKQFAGKDSPRELQLDTAVVLSNWCRVRWMSGDLNEHVYSALREVLRIRTELLDQTHMDVASSHYNLGVAEYARRSRENSVKHLMRYLQVAALRAQQGLGSDLDPIPALIYLLLIKNEDKDDSMAQELVRGLSTLQDKRNDLGPQHPEIASVLNFIGTLLFHQRDFDHALLFFQEELRLEETFVTGNDDASVSVTCNNIGRILQELQRLPEAVGYYNRALQSEYGEDIQRMSTKASTKQQPMDTAQALARNENLSLPMSTMNLYSTVWYNLGLIHDKQGSYGEAIHAFQMSLGLRRVMLGPDHPDVACLLYNIGVLQMEQQLLRYATDSFREALRIRRVAATGQLNDCHVVKTLQKLASLHKAKGNIEGALEAGREILHIQQLSPDFESVSRNKEMGSTLREMAELYHAQGNTDMALTKAKESVAVLRLLGNVPVESEEYVSSIENFFASLLLLGSLYHEKCEPAEAFVLFQEASAIVYTASKKFAQPTALDALYEVSQMLATCHCAAEA